MQQHQQKQKQKRRLQLQLQLQIQHWRRLQNKLVFTDLICRSYHSRIQKQRKNNFKLLY